MITTKDYAKLVRKFGFEKVMKGFNEIALEHVNYKAFKERKQ